MSERLTDLLDASQAAIRCADFVALAALTEAISVAEPCTTAAELAEVRLRAQRNAALLEAATAGFRAARRRVADIRAARAGLATYDDKGARLRLEPTGPLTLRQRI